MSLPPSKSPTPDQQTEEEAAAIRALVDSFAKSNLYDDPDSANKDSEKAGSKLRPMRTYTREQLLYLSASPLVQLPPNMPDLKQWFGDNELLLTKKDGDLTTPSSGRDRRFRREPEDGEISSRPSFRSTLSQPSQMGNFKHQSLRSGDRDRDRERDGDRDRDNRDKEGLRHLSDKYDRDRLVLLPAGTRGKERESASHLNANSSTRSTIQNQSSIGGRRGDARDTQKKRSGETGDDWRRNDGTRSTRDDRDDRERARSKAREPSRSRRSPSRPRREKDDGKDRPSRNERDRGDYGRDDYRRDRERDNDRDQEDDPRRWRDDGKRDERVAARRAERDRELRAARERERGDHWEPSSDRRWAGNDDRDGRYKRASTRDRKSGGNTDELRDRDERREREKEKEPAWMETYVPTSSSGILGGKSSTGELDGIQAWKKGLKEKESVLEEKNAEPSEPDLPPGQDLGERGLDEIQLFKMLMRREEEKKKTEGNPSSSPIPSSIDMESRPVTTNESVSTPSQTAFNSQLFLVPNPGSSMSTSPPFTQESHSKNQSSSGMSSDFLPTDNSMQLSEKFAMDSNVYNPPAGSRLLALGRTSAKSPVNPISGSSTSNGLAIETIVKPGTPRAPASFSPFEEQLRLGEENNRLPISGQFEQGPQSISDKHFGSLAPNNSFDGVTDGTSLAYATNKGSRFAKFFDNRPKEGPGGTKLQTPTGYLSSSPNPPQRQEHVMLAGTVGAAAGPTERTMDDIFAMLNNSSQAQRANMVNHPTPHHPLNENILSYQANTLNNLPPQLQPHHLQSNSRLDALYDSHLDDRNFVPDGMVPGLRPAPPPPRGRDNLGLYPDSPDEALQFHLQRLQQQQQQHRGHDPFGGPSQSIYGPQNGRAIHQAQFRGGPSPGVGLHNPLPNLQPQRLPPGLANLGGRPPHDPIQLLGLPGHPNALHSSLHPNAPLAQQQTFNNFAAASNLNYNNIQLRGPIPNIPQLQNAIPHSGLGAMGLGNNVDLRSQNPAQLLGVGGPNLPGPRGANMLFNPQQSTHHLQGPHPGARQQQAHLPPPPPPPHVPLNIMPPHLQQQPLNGSNNGHANELIALLMGGPGLPRE